MEYRTQYVDGKLVFKQEVFKLSYFGEVHYVLGRILLNIHPKAKQKVTEDKIVDV
jgi:hypothetical protein